MKTFYYFSKSKLKFIEIKNFQRKFILILLGSSLLFSGLLFSAYYFYTNVITQNSKTKQLMIENKLLAQKIDELLDNYEIVETTLDSLSDYNNDLRLQTNLRPITIQQRKTGIGGSINVSSINVSSSELKDIVYKLDTTVARVTAKLNFEKSNYTDITRQFNNNKKLFESIPAIKPAGGRIGDQFGMRMHPVLKYRRMHEGIDILVDIGSKVMSSGKGKVVTVKRSGDLGLYVEIDHGYGYITRYGHLSKASVQVGQKINRGDVIALSGNTGRLTTGPHLHYEVIHNGIALDPESFIYNDIHIFDNN